MINIKELNLLLQSIIVLGRIEWCFWYSLDSDDIESNGRPNSFENKKKEIGIIMSNAPIHWWRSAEGKKWTNLVYLTPILYLINSIFIK